jgi:aryl-alcohol dehydrogenase-like predicted oxidoreductase
MLEVAKKNKIRFDAVQFPLNVMDAHFRSFERQLLPMLTKEGIGVLGMTPPFLKTFHIPLLVSRQVGE